MVTECDAEAVQPIKVRGHTPGFKGNREISLYFSARIKAEIIFTEQKHSSRFVDQLGAKYLAQSEP